MFTYFNIPKVYALSFPGHAGNKPSSIPGFCVDTGAPVSVVGLQELRCIFRRAGAKPKPLRKSFKRFRFADSTFQSLGLIDLPLATPNGIPPIYITMDVVAANVPALLGLDVLDEHSLTPNTVSNELVKCSAIPSDTGVTVHYWWNVPMTRFHGHVYVAMSIATPLFYSTEQLRKLHRQFAHPSTDKLYKLLRRARPEDTSPETFATLQELARRCDTCQRIQSGPVRFRVSFGAENVKFNERIYMDIMYIDGKPVLHIVDEGTHFSAAAFLPDVSTKTIWTTILECWAAIYTGLPHKILVDQGSQFGELFVSIGAASKVQVDRTGIEAHSSLGIGERYHQPLRNTYRKLKIDFANVAPQLLLAMSVKALNDTLGPEGLVPSALVFGEYPSTRLYTDGAADPRASLESRARLATAARKEMERHMASVRIKRALRHSVPPSADVALNVGQKVLVWREKQVENRIGEWIGPFVVQAVDREKKLVFVQDSTVGAVRPFGQTQVKPYLTADEASTSFFQDLREALTSAYSQHTFLTEVISPTDPRAYSPQMTAAKRKEIMSLMRRGTFKVILKEEIPPDGNVLPGRFVLAIKSTEDDRIKFKARFVIGGHRDKLKKLLVHSSQSIQPASVRLLLTLSAMHGFETWTSDVTQAYLQSAKPLNREVYIRNPPPEFELADDEALVLLRALYGLGESGDLWHETLDEHHRSDLGMTPLRSDPACYFALREGVLQGMSGTYVDDMLRAGNANFARLCEGTRKRFDMSEDARPPCTFTGFRLSRDKATLMLDQLQYTRRLRPLPSDASFSQFASVRMQLMWLSHSRPDCLFEISQLTQVTRDMFDTERKDIVKRANRVVSYAMDNPVTISFPQLDLDSVKVIGYSDASFANNRDLSSQLGYVVFMVDDQNHAIPIVYKSYKARRVTRSVMAAELIAFSDLFDVSYTLSQELRLLHPTAAVPVHLFTDSKSLFDIISKGTRTSEKRLMLDIACAREGYRRKDIHNIGFVRSGDNVADGLTKSMQQATLRAVLKSGKLVVNPEQWIIRGQ